jgi:hypothetical protein
LVIGEVVCVKFASEAFPVPVENEHEFVGGGGWLLCAKPSRLKSCG